MSKPNEYETEIVKLRDKMNRILNSFSGEIEQTETLDRAEWVPSLDVLENKDEIIVKIDIPGMTSDGIDLSISGEVLRISGERNRAIERKDENYHTIECNYGRFDRRIVLPTLINIENVKASYKDGILTIRLPKLEEKEGVKVRLDL